VQAPVKPALPRVYSPDDPSIVPPIIVRQMLPPYPAQNVPNGQGVVEVIIDETGAVETAVMRVSVNPIYDRVALAAARTWRYKPASVNGVPVKFRKDIQITLKPGQ
jgi:TonB family protein